MKHVFLLALLLAPALGQEPPEKEAAAEPANVPEEVAPSALRHEVRLRGGSTLVGKLEPEKWFVQTAFGRLEVPVAEVREVQFGRRSQPDRLAAVLGAIEDLASANPKRRDHARAALKQEGAFGAASLTHAVKEHADPEVRRLCKEILAGMEVEATDYVPDEDSVSTTRFNLTGTIELKSFRISVPELGTLQLRRDNVVSIGIFAQEATKRFLVEGKHVWPAGWLDTGIAVKKGANLRITATGTLHFPNWGGQVFTPDGNPQMGNIGGMAIGTLAGRIGDGKTFRIGSGYLGTAETSGKLQLAVVMNVQGQKTNGGYKVRVSRTSR